MRGRDDPPARTLRGEVVRTFAFDVAYEIATERVTALLGRAPTRSGVRGERAAPRAVPPYRPLEVELPSAGWSGGRPVRVVVRVYDVGVVAVTLRLPVEAAGPADLRAYHALALDDGRPAEVVAAGLCADVCRELGPHLTRPGPTGEPETYAVFCLTELGGVADATAWLTEHARGVAGLLADADPDRLSDARVEEGLRLRRSFERSDLVVVDWDAALVVDLGGEAEDALLVLEAANVQLAEFRWVDRTLDAALDQAHDDLGRRWPPRTAAVLRSLRRLRVDLARLADEVANITKFVGDWHLARVYLLARERFHLDAWRASVEHRLGQLDQLYTLLRGDFYERRMLWLEVAILALIAVELVPALAPLFAR